MKKYFFTILIALIVGFLLSKIMLGDYFKENSFKISSSSNLVYFIQYGVYSTKESMDKNTLNLENFVYLEDGGKYYVFIGITMYNQDKILNFYKDKGYEVILKQYGINNTEFINHLKNYDDILKNTEDKIAIGSILGQVLRDYEEVVNNGGKNQGNS